MSLAPGARIGPYEILHPLGAGGMGEVYRARDGKLNRDVAIKVLPELFSADPDRLARFRREAQVLASLNHQNIGHIYGLEDQSGIHALVLELVEGPTLADRIAPASIPLDEAIPIARQIADALECAHELGIIHRDLKPANIKVRPDGTVKVLDFGLAKALDPASASSPDAMNSPTITARGTQLGLIVGTAAYMSPEQARGKAVDRRADMWAFGVVLYEMLSGTRAFHGDDVSITLASVLKDDVNWKALPSGLPPPILRLLRRCLEKDPKRRLSAAADARIELEDAAGPASDDRRDAAPAPLPSWRRLLPWGMALAAVLISATSIALWAPWRSSEPRAPIRFSSELGTPGPLMTDIGDALVLSPDGRMLAIVARNGQGRPQLYIRPTSELQAVALTGTEGASAPFFSPDGQSIAFFATGALKKVAVTGGATVTLCPAVRGRGGDWDLDGTIFFQPNGAPGMTLHRVADTGGTPVPFGKQAEGETTQSWPQVLPGRRGVLYSGNSGTTGWDQGSIMVQPLDGGSPKLLWRGGYHARYVPTGHLLYIHQATLFALPFDLDSLTVTGSAAPVIEGVLSTTFTGGTFYSVSGDGSLVYVPGSTMDSEAPIHLLDGAGKLTVLRPTAAEWYFPRFSPDGRKLAVTIGAGSESDVWIHESGRDLTKFTFEPGNDLAPVWTPLGDRLAFASSRPATAPTNLYWQRSTGTGPVERLTDSPSQQIPYSFDPTGKYLAFIERPIERNLTRRDNDIMILPLDGNDASGWKPGKATAFLATPHNETTPVFSPDGQWLAYMSNETGTSEVYVRPFPSGNEKLKISTDGGVHPRWSKTKSELLYARPGAQLAMMSVAYRVQGGAFVSEVPKPWSAQPIESYGVNAPFDLHPDGLRIVMKKPSDSMMMTRDKAIFVFNFFDELRRIAPVK